MITSCLRLLAKTATPSTHPEGACTPKLLKAKSVKSRAISHTSRLNYVDVLALVSRHTLDNADLLALRCAQLRSPRFVAVTEASRQPTRKR